MLTFICRRSNEVDAQIYTHELIVRTRDGGRERNDAMPP